MRHVGIRTRVQLDCIDDLNQQVRMDFMVAFHFEDPNITPLDEPGPPFVKIADHKEKGVFSPKIEFDNLVNDDDNDDDGGGGCDDNNNLVDELVLQSRKTGMIYIVRHYRVVLREKLELERFPFDRQVVKLTFRAFQAFNADAKFQKWIAPKDDIPTRIRNIPNWQDHENVVEYDDASWVLEWTENELKDADNQYVYTASFGVSRQATYYLWNFVFVLFIIVESASCTLAIDPNDFGARSGLTFTLLLTLVAFKLSMSSFIPKISYQTYLDVYNLICISAVTSVIVENFLVSGFDEIGKKFDLYFIIVFNVVWLWAHLLLLIALQFGWFYENWADVRINDAKDCFQRIFSDLPVATTATVGAGLRLDDIKTKTIKNSLVSSPLTALAYVWAAICVARELIVIFLYLTGYDRTVWTKSRK